MAPAEEIGNDAENERERRRLVRLLNSGAAGGITLTAALVAAVVWASVDPSGYAAIVDTPVHLPLVPSAQISTIGTLVTNLGVIVFFFAIGLEVARERSVGVLADNRAAIVPVVAAVGGMAGAAVTYLLLVGLLGPHAAVGGWGIPMATDIAFTLGAVSLIGTRVPPSLRVFLLTLAVADDVLSVVVLAAVGHERLASTGFPIALTIAVTAVICGGLFVARRRQAPWPAYLVGGMALWWCLARLGIEPTLAGVVAGIAAPTGHDGHLPGPAMERWAVPVSSYAVLPAFAFVAGGVDLAIVHLSTTGNLFTAVLGARLLGKLVGICGAVAIAVRLGIGQRPAGSSWRQMAGASILCGIGFTVPLLFAVNAFGSLPGLLATTKVALLVASILCGALGLIVLRQAPSRSAETG